MKGVTVTVAGGSYSEALSHDGNTGFTKSRTSGGLTSNFEPDARGNVAATVDGLGQRTEFTYDWGVLKDTITPAYTISRAINPTGTPASEARGGGTTTFYYDLLDRLCRTVPPADAELDDTVTSYDNGSGRSATTTRGTSSVTTSVDGFSRQIGTVNAVGTHTRTDYDSSGRKSFESYPYVSAPTGDTFAYDALDRVTRVTHPDGSSIGYVYGATDVTITDEEGHATTQHRAAFGDPDDTRLDRLDDAAGKSWAYSYDAIGNLTRMQPPEERPARTWSYDSGSRRIRSETHPESGTTTYDEYDAAGNLKRMTDARNQVFTFSYDPNNRLARIDAPGDIHDVTDIRYNAFDARVHAKNASVDSTSDYDHVNRLIARTDVIAGQSFTVRYDYDRRGNLSEVQYPQGREVVYDYDSGARVTRVADRDGHIFAQDIGYHPSGAVSSLTSGNGLVETFTYDARYRPKVVDSGPLHIDYAEYFRNGNLRTLTDSRPGYSQAFEYDELNRLKIVTGLGAGMFE